MPPSSQWVEWGSALILGVLLLALARESALRPVDFLVVFGGRRLALMYEAASPYFFGTLVLFAALVLVTLRMKQLPNTQLPNHPITQLPND